MSNFGFVFASFLQSGNGTTSIQIPGVFAGPTPTDPTNAGRYLKNVMVWSANAADGDAITSLTLEDTDGVVPAQLQGQFPNYPVIFDLLDTVAGQTKQLPIPTAGMLADSFDPQGGPLPRFLPAQLYLKMTFAVGGLNLGRTFRGVIRWGLWS